VSDYIDRLRDCPDLILSLPHGAIVQQRGRSKLSGKVVTDLYMVWRKGPGGIRLSAPKLRMLTWSERDQIWRPASWGMVARAANRPYTPPTMVGLDEASDGLATRRDKLFELWPELADAVLQPLLDKKP
jgi:hypothetical protein